MRRAREVEAMGRSAAEEVAAEKLRRELAAAAAAAAEAEAAAAAAAAAARDAHWEGAVAQRELEMDAAYATHLQRQLQEHQAAHDQALAAAEASRAAAEAHAAAAAEEAEAAVAEERDANAKAVRPSIHPFVFSFVFSFVRSFVRSSFHPLHLVESGSIELCRI